MFQRKMEDYVQFSMLSISVLQITRYCEASSFGCLVETLGLKIAESSRYFSPYSNISQPL